MSLVISTFLLSQAPLPAAPSWTHLYPSGAQLGTTVQVEIVGGKFETWPVQVWVDHAGIKAKAGEKKGTLDVEVSADCPPGLHWLRLYDSSGATAPRPFVVGASTEVLEKESNDTPAKAQELPSSACVVNGRLQKNGDTDNFAIEVPAGRTLVASMLAHHRLGSAMDAVLQIVSADGFVLAQNHDTQGLDPELAFAVPAAGRYVVRAFAFPSQPNSSIRFTGNESYIYRLTVTTQAFADYTVPLSLERAVEQSVDLVGWNLSEEERRVSSRVTDDREALELHAPGLANAPVLRVYEHPSLAEDRLESGENSLRIAIPCSVTGVLSKVAERDVFEFEGKKGERLVFRLEAREFGSPIDPLLSLLGPDAKSIARTDDSRGSRDAEIASTLPADGRYRLRVADLHGRGGRRHVYRLTCQRQTPSFSLVVDVDQFTVAAGARLEVVVKVQRLYGFSDSVEISPVDPPAGVTCEAVVSENKGENAKQVKLNIDAKAGPFSGPLMIRGTVPGRPESSRFARFALGGLNLPRGLDTASHLFWLTVTETKKEG